MEKAPASEGGRYTGCAADLGNRVVVELAALYVVVENLENHILSWRLQKNIRFIKIHILCTENSEFS
jgi:hypothetical protein